MNGMDEILENANINAWVRHFLRSPHQRNRPHESDAELIEIPGNRDHYLAITIDTVAEEIATGLYRDPHTVGWVAVMSSMSDLAATGAEPLGLAISLSVEPDRGKESRERLAKGVDDACRSLGVFVLGGDMNDAPGLSLTTCAVGLVPRKEVLMRRGCRASDALFATGPMGMGNALALARLCGLPTDVFPEDRYRPRARLEAGKLLRRHATCCMDTSDGLLATLDQLMRLNRLGFAVDCDWGRVLSPEVMDLCDRTNTPPWLMTAGLHGEFELIFTIAKHQLRSFQKAADAQGFSPLRLGIVQASPVVSLILKSGRTVDVDTAALRNMLYRVEGDLQRYVQELNALGEGWGLCDQKEKTRET